MIRKYLETCQNLVVTYPISLINRLKINVLFQSCVWRLVVSKTVFFMSCINALWCYWNILIAFMNVFNEFHLKCDVIYLMGLNDSLHPDTVQTQRNIAFCLRCRVNQKALNPTVSRSALSVWVLCCTHRRSGLGTLHPGASGLVSRLNWITAGASARRDEMASQDGYKVKKQPQRKQCLCHRVGGRSVSDSVLLRRVLLYRGRRKSEGKRNTYFVRTLIISAAWSGGSYCFFYAFFISISFPHDFMLHLLYFGVNNNS